MAERLISNINVKISYLDNMSVSIQDSITKLYDKIENNNTTNECNYMSRGFVNSYTTYYTATLKFAKDELYLADVSSNSSDLSTEISSIYTIGDSFMLCDKNGYYYVSVPGANKDYSKLYKLIYPNTESGKTDYNLGKNIFAYNDKVNNAIDIIFMKTIKLNDNTTLKGFFIIRIDKTKDDTIYYIHKDFDNSDYFDYENGIFYEIKGKLPTYNTNNIDNILLYSTTENNKRYVILTPYLNTFGNGTYKSIQFVDLQTETKDQQAHYAAKTYLLNKGLIMYEDSNYYFGKAISNGEASDLKQITCDDVSVITDDLFSNYYWFTNTDGSIINIFVKPPGNNQTIATLYYLDSDCKIQQLLTIPELVHSDNLTNIHVCSDEWYFSNNLMITNNGNVQQFNNLTYMFGDVSKIIPHYCNSYKGDRFYVLLPSSTAKKYIIGVIYPFNCIFSVI